MAVVLDERFLSKVDVRGENECWTWTAYTDPKGYGIFMYPSGAPYRVERAHVLSYCADRGLDLNDLPADPSVPNGRQHIAVCHVCDVPSCVNPNHLVIFEDGAAGNMRDMKVKGRAASGERNGMKTPEGRAKAFRIHELRAEHPDWTQRRIAQEVGWDFGHVSRILSGKQWPEVKEAFESEKEVS